jgi:hypothetical protein
MNERAEIDEDLRFCYKNVFDLCSPHKHLQAESTYDAQACPTDHKKTKRPEPVCASADVLKIFCSASTKQGQTATQQRSASQAAEKVQLSFLGNPVLRCAKHARMRLPVPALICPSLQRFPSPTNGGRTRCLQVSSCSSFGGGMHNAQSSQPGSPGPWESQEQVPASRPTR